MAAPVAQSDKKSPRIEGSHCRVGAATSYTT
jgi:hypothetical protein